MGHAIVLKNASYKGSNRVGHVTPVTPNGFINNTLTSVISSYSAVSNNTMSVSSTTITPSNSTANYSYYLNSSYTGLEINAITGLITISSGWTGGTATIKVVSGSSTVNTFSITVPEYSESSSIVTYSNLVIVNLLAYSSTISASGGSLSPTTAVTYSYQDSNGNTLTSDCVVTYSATNSATVDSNGNVTIPANTSTTSTVSYTITAKVTLPDGSNYVESSATITQSKAVANTITLTSKSTGITAAAGTKNTYTISTTGTIGTLEVSSDSDKFNPTISGSTLTVTTVEDNVTSSDIAGTITIGDGNVSTSVSVSLPYARMTVSEVPTSVNVGDTVVVTTTVTPIISTDPEVTLNDYSLATVTGLTSDDSSGTQTVYTVTFLVGSTPGTLVSTITLGSQEPVTTTVTILDSSSSEIYITSATYDAANPVLNADGSGYYPLKITASNGITYDGLNTYNAVSGAILYTVSNTWSRTNIINGGSVNSSAHASTTTASFNTTTGKISLPAIESGLLRTGTMTPKVTLTPASNSGKSAIVIQNLLLSSGFCFYMSDTSDTSRTYTYTNNISSPKSIFTNSYSNNDSYTYSNPDYYIYKGVAFSSTYGVTSTDEKKSAMNSISVNAGDLVVITIEGWHNLKQSDGTIIDLRTGSSNTSYFRFVETSVPIIQNGSWKNTTTNTNGDTIFSYNRMVGIDNGAEGSFLYKVENDGYFTFGMFGAHWCHEMHISIISAS